MSVLHAFLTVFRRPVLATALLLACAITATAAEDAADDGTPKHFVLLDAGNGVMLDAKAPDTAFEPASLTKLMTLTIAFEEIKAGRLSLDKPVLITEHIWRTGGAPARVSTMFARVNSHVVVRDLLRGVAVVVGNDAALALADAVAGSEAAFVERMNARAKELGLTGSRFVNATGLPAPGQRTTARDMARLARHLATGFPELYPVFSEAELDWSNIRQRNRNPLITPMFGKPAYEGADGLTMSGVYGYGYSMAASAQRNGKRLVAVVVGLQSEEERASAARDLLERGFTGFTERQLFARGAVVAQAMVHGGASGRVPLVASDRVVLEIPKDGDARIEAKAIYRGPLTAPIVPGTSVGTLKVWRDGMIQSEIPLLTAAEVPVGSLWQRALDAGYELAVGAIRSAAAHVPAKLRL